MSTSLGITMDTRLRRFGPPTAHGDRDLAKHSIFPKMIDLTDDGETSTQAQTRQLPYSAFASAPMNSFLPAWNQPSQSYHQATLQQYHNSYGTASTSFQQQSTRLPSISEGLYRNNSSIPGASLGPGVPLVPTYTYHPPGPQPTQPVKSISAYEANMASRSVVSNNIVANRFSVVDPLSVRFSVINHQSFTARAEKGEVTERIMDCLKRAPGAKFDTLRPQWLFPFSSHQFLAHALQKHGCSVEMIPPGIIAAAQLRSSSVLQENDASEITKFLMPLVGEHVLSHLASFQQEAVKFIYEKGGRALIADEMGLGKTRTAIGGAMLYQDDWPVLVVCPSSARYHWQEEIMNILSPHILDAREVTVVENGHHSVISTSSKFQYKFVIISYSLVNKLQTRLLNSHFGVVIADESHYLKTRKAQRTKALLPLIHGAKRALLLSGTPALSRPVELFTQLNALLPKVWSDFKAFGRRYCVDPRPSNEKSLFNNHNRFNFAENAFKGANNTQELHVILTSTIMIRRLKKDILKQLPQKKRYFVKVPIDDENDRRRLQKMFSKLGQYEEILKKKKSFSQSFPVNHDHLGNDEFEFDETMKKRKSLLLELYRDSGPAKLPSILKQLKRFLDSDISGGKILVFAHHRLVLDGICRFLREYQPPSNDNNNSNNDDNSQNDYNKNDSAAAGVEFIRIDGTTLSSDRHQRTYRFQTDPKVRVAVLGISAAGIALTLTAAHMVFFAEMFWTPGSLIQAEDRAHRIGQVRDVKIFYFFADGSIDELLWPMVRKKLQLLGEIVEGKTGLDLAALSKNNVVVQTKPAKPAINSANNNNSSSTSRDNLNNNSTNNSADSTENNNHNINIEGEESNSSVLKKRKSGDNVYQDEEGRLVFDLLEDDDDFDELMNEMVKESTHEFDDSHNASNNNSSSIAAATNAVASDDDNDSDREEQPDDYEEYLKRPFPPDKFALFHLQELQKKEKQKLETLKTQYLKQEEMKLSHPHLSDFLSISQNMDPSFVSPPRLQPTSQILLPLQQQAQAQATTTSRFANTIVVIDDSDDDEKPTTVISSNMFNTSNSYMNANASSSNSNLASAAATITAKNHLEASRSASTQVELSLVDLFDVND